MIKDNLKQMARSRRKQGLKYYKKAIFSVLVTALTIAVLLVANLSDIAILAAVFGCVIAIKFALQGNKAIARSADVETDTAREQGTGNRE